MPADQLLDSVDDLELLLFREEPAKALVGMCQTAKIGKTHFCSFSWHLSISAILPRTAFKSLEPNVEVIEVMGSLGYVVRWSGGRFNCG